VDEFKQKRMHTDMNSSSIIKEENHTTLDVNETTQENENTQDNENKLVETVV
jgi:hypothetical protein